MIRPVQRDILAAQGLGARVQEIPAALTVIVHHAPRLRAGKIVLPVGPLPDGHVAPVPVVRLAAPEDPVAPTVAVHRAAMARIDRAVPITSVHHVAETAAQRGVVVTAVAAAEALGHLIGTA